MENIENFKLVGIILYLFFITLLLILIYKKKGDFWHSIVGPDGELDPLDVVKLLWLVLFPIITLSDLFLDFKVDEIVWISLDAILFGLILRDLGAEYIKKDTSKEVKK